MSPAVFFWNGATFAAALLGFIRTGHPLAALVAACAGLAALLGALEARRSAR